MSQIQKELAALAPALEAIVEREVQARVAAREAALDKREQELAERERQLNAAEAAAAATPKVPQTSAAPSAGSKTWPPKKLAEESMEQVPSGTSAPNDEAELPKRGSLFGTQLTGARIPVKTPTVTVGKRPSIEEDSDDDGKPVVKNTGSSLFGNAAQQVSSSEQTKGSSVTPTKGESKGGLFGSAMPSQNSGPENSAQPEVVTKKYSGNLFGSPAAQVSEPDRASGTPAQPKLFGEEDDRVELTTESCGTATSIKDMFEQKTKDTQATTMERKVSWKVRQNTVDLPAGGKGVFPAHDQNFRKSSRVAGGTTPGKQRQSLADLLKGDEDKLR